MSSTSVTQTQHPLFPALDDKATVQVHALSAGHLPLPGEHPVHPASDTPRNTVPSLSFLVQHVDFESGKRTRILFDLGLRRDSSRSSDPTPTDPDVVKSLAAGGLTPNDIDYVILSHLHRNHIGNPSAFPHSTFITGPGSLAHSHSHLDRALPPAPRTIELPSPASGAPPPFSAWRPCPARLLPHTLDVFADSSLLVVDAPPARLVLLARTGPGRLVCLAGDAGDDGPTCGAHADDADAAAETAGRLRRLREELGVEVVGAHDGEWERGNAGRFWGAEVEEGME